MDVVEDLAAMNLEEMAASATLPRFVRQAGQRCQVLRWGWGVAIAVVRGGRPACLLCPIPCSAVL